MKPKYNIARFRNPSLATAIIVCFGTTFARGAENVWTGTTDSQWNTATNWSAGHVPEKAVFDENAIINTNSGNIATIVGANILKTPRDILIGNSLGTVGILNHISGDALTGGDNWLYAGKDGGTGTYNLADTAVADPGISGFAQGSGNMIVSGVLFTGNGAGGNGTVNINTTGSLSTGANAVIGEACIGKINLQSGTFNIGGEFWVGQAGGGNGTFRMTDGTVSITNWVAVGRGAATGKIIVEGGSFTKTNGGGSLAIGNQTGSKGEFAQSGGTVTVNSTLRVADGSGATGSGKYTLSGGTLNVNGETWVGQGGGSPGTMDVSDGVINSTNWVAFGREGGTGVLNMTAGIWTKTGGGNFICAGASGTLNISGGLVDVQSGAAWIPEVGNGTLNLSDTAEFRTGTLSVAQASGSGTVNLNGGTLRLNQLIGGGGATRIVNFNGTEIIARQDNATFIDNLTAATINTGGLYVNSSGFSLTAPQPLGGGGIVKAGLGTLSLTGANTYIGDTAINEGRLVTTTASDATGAITLADFTGFGITQTAIDEVYNSSALTFGSNETVLDFNLGNFAGTTANAPLNVTGPVGSLNLDGDVTVNIADTNISTGVIPLISYSGPKQGFGSFILGNLPDGVVATLLPSNVAGPSSLSLNVTRANDPYWTGTTNSLWNTTDNNWINEYGAAATNFANGDPAMFDDRVDTGPTAVILNGTVTPGGSGVTFNNTAKNYSLTGTGKITGDTGLLKLGAGSVDIATANDYQGATTITAGSINIGSLPNVGAASPIGINDNLELNGGTLNYTGATTTTDRGFTVSGVNGAIGTTNNLTMSGLVSALAGGLVKLGAGNLTLTNDSISLSAGGVASRVNGGTMSLVGSGSQSVFVSGDLWVGSTTTASGNLVLQNTTLNVSAWFALGRGNGDTGILSTVTANNSVIQTTNVSVGFNGDLPTNDSDQTVTLNDSTWTNSAWTLLGESQNTQTNMTLSGTSSFVAGGRFRMALSPTSICNVIVEDDSSISATAGGAWFSIGDPGTAVLTLRDNGTLTTTGIDLNVTDNAGSKGTLNIQDNATVNAGTFFFGKGANSVANVNISGGTFNGGVSEIAQNGSSSATITQTGGTMNFGNNDRMWFAQGGQATWNQSAGEVNCNGWLVIGRGTNSVGEWNVSGGTLNQTTANQGLILAEQGTGTLTISGTGVVDSAGGQVDIATNGGTGTLNLNAGGTLRARQVVEFDSGTSSVNFNGGTLVANPDAKLDFFHGIDTATINAGGATIDSNGQDFQIAQSFQGTGDLVKTGLGAVAMDGTNTFPGSTTVSAGALGGTGSLTGPLVVSAGATLAPGHSIGTLTAGATTISGTYACEIGGAAADKLVANGTLDVSAASLVVTELSPASASVLVIASYTGSTPAPFASVSPLPPGYSVVYNHGGNQIALVGSVTAYNTWATAKITNIDAGADASKGGDPDGDGSSNISEFALNGNPLSGASSGKVVGKVASVGGNPTLVLTLPVRTGAVFSGTTEQVSALIDEVVYRIQGSDQLATWNLAVSEVTGADKTAIEEDMPALETGWTYRTFQSPGSVTGDPAEFLRAVITTP